MVGSAALGEVLGIEIARDEPVVDVDSLGTDRPAQVPERDRHTVSPVRHLDAEDQVLLAPHAVAREVAVLLVDHVRLGNELGRRLLPAGILGRPLDVEGAHTGRRPAVSGGG